MNSHSNLIEDEDENLLKEKQENTTDSEKSIYFQNLLPSSISSSVSPTQPQPSTSAGLTQTTSPNRYPTKSFKKLDDTNLLDATEQSSLSFESTSSISSSTECKTNFNVDKQIDKNKNKLGIKRKLSLGASYLTPKKKYSSQEAEIRNFGAPTATAKFDEKKEEQPKVALPPPTKERVRKRVGIPVEDPSLDRGKNPRMSVFDRRYTDSSVNGFVSSSRGSSSTTSSHNDDVHTTSQILNNHHYSSQPMQTNASTPSMATLCNIGNSCYLNSVVYTLRFAPLFLHNLHHLIDDLAFIQKQKSTKTASLGRNIPGLGADLENIKISTPDNDGLTFQMSSHQIATMKLHELYQSLHKNEVTEHSEPFHTDTFLNAIQKVSAIFEGNQQQDAHEFLMCVLDNIRETCQMLIKEIMKYPEVFFNM